MNKTKIPSSKKQRQLIAMACSYFHIEKEDKKAMLTDRYNESSSTDLTFAQAEDLIDDFVKKGFCITSKKRPYFRRKSPVPTIRKPKIGDNLVVLATPAEMSKIDALAGLIQWKVEEGMARWIKKRFKISKVKTATEAFKVIEGLKGMFENQMKKLHGPDWFLKDYSDNIEVCHYIAEHFPKPTPSYSYINGIYLSDKQLKKHHAYL